MPEPADIPEATPLLPQGADGLTPQGGFTVAEGTAVSLVACGIEEEVAVVSVVGHAAEILGKAQGFALRVFLQPG